MELSPELWTKHVTLVAGRTGVSAAAAGTLPHVPVNQKSALTFLLT